MNAPGQTTPVSDVVLAASQFIRAEAALVTSVASELGTEFEAAAAMVATVDGKIVFSGAGTSGCIARRAAHLFTVSGTPAMFLHPADALHGRVACLQARDLLVVLSKGGDSDEVNTLVELAKDAGVHAIALTSKEGSRLAAIADLIVVLPTDDVCDPGGLIAMGSTLAYSAWLDSLAYVLMRAKGYDFRQVHHSHPSGIVGKATSLPGPLEPLALP